MKIFQHTKLLALLLLLGGMFLAPACSDVKVDVVSPFADAHKFDNKVFLEWNTTFMEIERYAPGYVAVFERSVQSAKLHEMALKMKCSINENSSGIFVRTLRFEDILEYQKLVGITALQIRPSNLEDVFLMLTGSELNIND